MKIYGTLGPSCTDIEVLRLMFREGMTGIRVNTSHVTLKEYADAIENVRKAADLEGITPDILMDMQGPELRIGKIDELELSSGERLSLSDIEAPHEVLKNVRKGMEILLKMTSDEEAEVLRGGVLKAGKSIAVAGMVSAAPALTEQDMINIRDAAEHGVTGFMQPFVRSGDDLLAVRRALDEAGAENIRIFAKVENMEGVRNLESFFEISDEIVIARGDLGNDMPLWELPGVQKDISKRCKKKNMPFMVVTQMLSSMENNPVPTRAEVSDIYNAACDGAASVMVTGETAVGKHPVEVIRYLARTAGTYEGD